MHNVDKRPPYMAEAYHLIKEEYGEQRAQALFVGNQELLLADELI
jgi:protein-tyrosine-phosphatase